MSRPTRRRVARPPCSGALFGRGPSCDYIANAPLTPDGVSQVQGAWRDKGTDELEFDVLGIEIVEQPAIAAPVEPVR